MDKRGINLQPYLGKFKTNYKPNRNMGHLALAKVLTVHHKHNTADVQLVRTKEVISSSPDNEGRFAARIGTSSAHFNPNNGASSGVVEPIQEGQLVLLAFLDGNKTSPIIIMSFHDTFERSNNILPDYYPINPRNSMEEYREALQSLHVHPSQWYRQIDGIGAMEMGHPSKTFLKVDPDLYDEISDEHGGYDHENLSVRDPITGLPREGRIEQAVLPVKMLFSHRSGSSMVPTDVEPELDEFGEPIYNIDPKWTKFFLDKSGLFRITRDNNDDKLTFAELTAEGDYRVRRQIDTNERDKSKSYMEFLIGSDGSMTVEQMINGELNKFEFSSAGKILLSHLTGSYMEFTKEGDINFNVKGKLNGLSKMVHVGYEPPEDPEEGMLWIDLNEPDK